MAYNAQLTHRVRQSFADTPNVEEKKMFRGVAFMVNNKMCVTVGDNEIMCRIDPALHNELVATKNCRNMIMNGREYKGCLLVNEETFTTKKELDFWINLALQFNPKAIASKKKKQ